MPGNKFRGVVKRGRPPGTVNKTTQEVRDAARAIIDDPEYRESLIARMKAGKAPHMEPLMWHYGYGKPKETIEVQGDVTVSKIVLEIIDPTDVHEALPPPLMIEAAPEGVVEDCCAVKDCLNRWTEEHNDIRACEEHARALGFPVKE